MAASGGQTKTPDALARYLSNNFPTANPTLPVYPTPAQTGPNNADLVPGVGAYSPPPPPSSGGGTSGGGGTTGGSHPNAPLDWRAYLENWGFDADIVSELDRIFRTYSDVSQASASALAYIRGTEWYSKNFPGIQEGEKLGIITDERGYRAYTNNLNDVYQRYYGRAVTGDEVSNALKTGKNPNQINAHFQGQAYIAANRNEIQYDLGAFDENGQLTEDQLSQLGDQSAGLDNAMGQILQKRVSMATQKLHTIFGGSLVTPSTRLNTINRLIAPSLSGGSNTNDVAS